MCPMHNDVRNHNNMSATQSADNHPQIKDGEGKERKDNTPSPARKTSMATLITWNVSKALENNPELDLRSTIQAVHDRLEQSRDPSAVLTQPAAERHLACAVLAWQQLGHGHRDADSLYRFVALHLNEKNNNLQKTVETPESGLSSDVGLVAPARYRNVAVQGSEMRTRWSAEAVAAGPGPVLKLPVEPKLVLRLDSCKPKPACRPVCKKIPDVKGQIDSACCLDSSCSERLQAVDKATQDLRARAARLAQREADRVALLERAEAAWRDLEAGYERRLRLSEEKETEIESQTVKLINERNDYKNMCTRMVEQLTARTDAAEKQREELAALEKAVCDLACERASLAEQAARGNAQLVEELCRAAQLDRELMLKEEQARRKQAAMESEADGAQALTYETERALAGELCALKAQIEQVARELQIEDEEAAHLKTKLNNKRQEKEDLMEDLESCTVRCDGHMKGMVDELKRKREELAVLKLKEMDCHCKLPVDASVEVKRTPSLAALCQCSPEERLAESCSCTSLRSRLMTNLLSDLFSGLQSELNLHDTQMPCQLLKCLEDKHNWDRSSAVKSRLRDFFSKLLLGELDIAIATSIEKYHVKWVGESCADTVARLRPAPNCVHTQGWQERALELKAQKMATQLAEQLFKEKAKELAQQAKSILAETGRPPCECHPEQCCHSNMFPCLIDPPRITTSTVTRTDSKSPQKSLCFTLNDVSKLKKEIEELKKDIIKRDDLCLMEQKIAKIVQLVTVKSPTISLQNSLSPTNNNVKKYIKNNKVLSDGPLFRNNRSTGKSTTSNKKKLSDSPGSPSRPNRTTCNNFGTNNCNKSIKRPTQQFAINLCLLDTKKKLSTQSKIYRQLTNTSALPCPRNPSRDVVESVKQSKPALTLQECTNLEDIKLTPNCVKNCTCFHKKPSNTSIDKLLETLKKWKMDLVESPEQLNVDKIQDTQSLVKTSHMSSSYTQNISVIAHKDSDSKTQEDVPNKSIKQVIPIKETNPRSQINVNQMDNFAELSTELPVPIDSEYMGAINLDKSVEHSCKCEGSENVKNLIYNSRNKFPFKCIYSTRCFCKDCASIPIRHEQGLDAQSIIFKKLISIESKTVFDKTAEICTENFTNTEIGDNPKSSFNNILQCPESPLYDNHIKCLGVTLTNITSNRKHKKRQKKDVDSKKDGAYHKHENMKSVKTYEDHILNHKSDSINFTSINDDQNNKKCLLNEDYYDGNKYEPEKDQTLYKSCEVKEEPCICCNNYDADVSKDLEVNAFQLLEEHLKGKLEEFKQAFCIPNADEEKIFSDILCRIKKLIAETTSSMACKCVGTKQVNGSWNRAYGLLQEYLRAKIARVKCQCDAEKYKNEEETVLPSVLKNISYLIKNDLQRLKDICKCKSVVSSQLGSNEKNRSELKSILLSEANHKIKGPKELDHDQPNQPTNLQQNKQGDSEYLQDMLLHDSIDPAFFKNNISAQVSLHPFMETRSCDALKKESQYTEVQTVGDMKNILSIDGYNNARSACDCCIVKSNEKTTKRLPLPNLIRHEANTTVDAGAFQETDVAVFPVVCMNGSNLENNTLADISTSSTDVKNNSIKSSMPYIGYTMNCTCDENLGCVCTKSTVRAINDRQKIKDIWKKNTTKKVAFPDVSYILNVDRTPGKLPKVDYTDHTGDFLEKSAIELKSANVPENNFRDSEISAINEHGIMLKKSKEKTNLSHEMTNTMKKYGNYISDNKMGDKFNRPSSVLSPSRRKSEHLSILKHNKVEDSYSPEYVIHGHVNSDHATKINPLSCDCKKVPLCHVKMLVANIEDKLANAQCTCDSLCAKVCPVHSTPMSN